MRLDAIPIRFWGPLPYVDNLLGHVPLVGEKPPTHQPKGLIHQSILYLWKYYAELSNVDS